MHRIVIACLAGLCVARAAAAQSFRLDAPFGSERTLVIDSVAIADLGGLREAPASELDPRLPYLLAKPLSGGRWAVADRGSILILDAHAGLVRRVGRFGDGPGEFRILSELCVVLGDTSVAVSLGDRRVVVFDSLGKHIRSAQLGGPVRSGGCLSDGSLLVATDASQTPHETDGTQVLAVSVAHWSSGELRDTGIRVRQSLDNTVQALATVVGVGHRIVTSDGAAAKLAVSNRSGELEATLLWDPNLIPVSQEMRREALRRGYRPSAVERRWLPVHGPVAAGDDGALWMQEYGLPWQRSLRVSRIDLDRREVASARLPIQNTTRVDIVWAGADRVLLGWRDEDGVPHLTLHHWRFTSTPR